MKILTPIIRPIAVTAIGTLPASIPAVDTTA